MASTVPRIQARRLNVGRHAIELSRDFPDSDIRIGPGRITWTGDLRPSPLSATYAVRIVYTVPRRPVVVVLAPDLVAPVGQRLPHVFPGNDLCLHFPGEWRPDMSIAATILPWTAEWLLHYEIWRATGRWTGGGHDPGPGPKSYSQHPSPNDGPHVRRLASSDH
jgi:hypothetical protein